MRTTNLIQSSANVVKITSLEIGNVVKVIEKEYNDTYKTIYGLVTDMVNSGEKSFITLCLYEKSYGDIKCSFKTYCGDKDLNIFPVLVDEVEDYFKTALRDMKKAIDDKKDELFKMEKSFQIASDFISKETSKKLTEASYKQVSQDEFNKLNAPPEF